MSNLKFAIALVAVAAITFGTAKKSYCQDNPSGSPKSVNQTSKALQKKEWERKRASERATKKALKAHMKHQTKDVRKRMKKDAKTADKNNGGGY